MAPAPWGCCVLSLPFTVSLLLLIQATAELPRDRWLCTGQAATGFAFDRSSRTWGPTTFKPDGRFTIAAVPMKAQTPPFQWVIAPEGRAVIEGGLCGSVFQADTFLHCSGFGGRFTFNRRSQRYMHWFPGGYASYAPGVNDITDEKADTPYIEIGTCTRL